MTRIRQRLRLWAATWLFFQVASLSAFVPRDCCAAHTSRGHHEAPAPKAQKVECHGAAAAAPSEHGAAQATPGDHEAAATCSLGPSGAACPMDHTGHGQAAELPPDDGCSLRGICGGPMAGLITVLSTYGVLSDAVDIRPDLPPGAPPVPAHASLIRRLATPDAPPPRA